MVQAKKDCCGSYKILMGLGIIIFSLVLYMTSTPTAIETNLNWSAAFFILGILVILKGIYYSTKK
jgi:hypothetical protein